MCVQNLKVHSTCPVPTCHWLSRVGHLHSILHTERTRHIVASRYRAAAASRLRVRDGNRLSGQFWSVQQAGRRKKTIQINVHYNLWSRLRCACSQCSCSCSTSCRQCCGAWRHCRAVCPRCSRCGCRNSSRGFFPNLAHFGHTSQSGMGTVRAHSVERGSCGCTRACA